MKKLLTLSILFSLVACTYLPVPGGEVESLRKQVEQTELLAILNGARSGTQGQTGSLTDLSASVKRSTALSLANNVYTDITFDQVLSDSGNYFNIATPTYLTIPQDGLYNLTGVVGFAANTAGVRKGNLVVNNAALGLYVPASVSLSANGTGTQGVTFTVSRTIRLSAGDKVYFQLYQDSGSALNADATQYSLIFTVFKVGN